MTLAPLAYGVALAGGNLRFPPTGPPSDTLRLVVGGHERSLRPRLLIAHIRPASKAGGRTLSVASRERVGGLGFLVDGS